jgi:hypothetical protein
MSKPMIRIHNTETDEVIDREMSDDEFEIYQAKQIKINEQKIEAEARAQAKAALLAQLGITEEQAKLLLS